MIPSEAIRVSVLTPEQRLNAAQKHNQTAPHPDCHEVVAKFAVEAVQYISPHLGAREFEYCTEKAKDLVRRAIYHKLYGETDDLLCDLWRDVNLCMMPTVGFAELVKKFDQLRAHLKGE